MVLARILIVDDNPLHRWGIRQQVTKWGYEALEAEDGHSALNAFRTSHPDLVLLDLRLGAESGLDVLEEIRQIDPSATVIMITGEGDRDDAVEGFRRGLTDFFTKPVDFGALHAAIRARLDASRLQEVASRARTAELLEHPIIGSAPALVGALTLMQKVATSDTTTVLLQGESGTGKDLFAKALHSLSPRRDEPFVAVNCGTLPGTLLESELFGHERGAFTDAHATKRGLFELANRGTVYLDEIGDVALPLQVKLLRAIEECSFRRLGGVRDVKVDARFVAASNRNLEQAVSEGTFRADLYYRLAVVEIRLPPLRERRQDIPALVDHLVVQLNRRLRRRIGEVTPEALEALMGYDWPGNVRELRNAIERAMILEEGDRLTRRYLPGGQAVTGGRENGDGIAPVSSTDPFLLPAEGISLELVEKSLVRQALALAEGNQIRAAKLLDIGRDALRYKMKKFAIGTVGDEAPD